MKPITLPLLLMISLLLCVSVLGQTPPAPPVQTTDNYSPGPDSLPQPGVPKGEVLKFTFDKSKIFPGTTREYWVYIPAQYKPDKPACVYVNQDGIAYEAPVVFDNLISKGQMPVTIGVFVRPGVVKSADANLALDRFNRSFEYDGISDNYVRFLLEEILPEVETKTATDGRPVHLSHSGNDRAIGGGSSGAICAFNVAWNRPDAFSRVFSSIGTYIGLRGADRFPTLIRKFEPKPIRVYLQDGSNDLNIYAGDWWMANQTMERALIFAGYEVEHVWGDGGHTGKHAASVFPDAMRFLWKDWPQPVKGGASKNPTLVDVLLPGEGWQLVAEGYQFTEGPSVNAKGEVFFNDVPAAKTYKIGLDGKVSLFLADSKRGDGQAFGPDGWLYAVATAEKKIIAWDPSGKPATIAEDIAGNDLVVAHNGNIYVTAPPQGASTDPSKIYLIKPDGAKSIVDTGIRFTNGITLSPDQAQLYVDDSRSHWVYSFMIQPDGTLLYKQQYGWLHVPDTLDQSSADGMRVDVAGRLYVATSMGLQICDQMGRVQCIVPSPNGRVANVTFGGENLDVLYAMCGDKVYKRKLKVKGAPAWAAPVKPTAPRM